MRKQPVVVIDKKSWDEVTETVAKKLAHQVYVASMEGNNDECLAFVEGLEARVLLPLISVLFEDFSDAEIASEPIIEYEENILDAKERKFIESLKCLRLVKVAKNKIPGGREYLTLKTKSRTHDGCSYNDLPLFPEGTMYKGMILNKWYTIDELLGE